MDFLYNALKLNKESRGDVITLWSGIGIVINLSIALLKIVIGTAISSMAIVSEGINNAADASSSALTLIGTKLAAKKPTRAYPFGFGRIEYLTSLVIGTIILVAGSELFVDSLKRILHPETVEVSYPILAIIALAAALKLVLSGMQISEGRRVDSSGLIAVGREGRQDSLGSVVTLASGLAYLLLGLNVDAYAGLFISCLVLKLGAEVLWDTLGKLLGQAGDKELADEIYRIIRQEPMIVNAADMMLHNYGPDAYSGSVNIEIDHKRSLGEIYKVIHRLQLHIMHEYHITMVFGLYAIDNDNPAIREMRLRIAEFIRSYEHVLAYHALYIDPENKDIYIDLLVDYDLADWDKLREDFTAYMAEHYPGQRLELVVETQYV